MIFIFYFLILGVFSGILSGLLGVGGGIVVVPVLVWIFLHQGIDHQVVMHLAAGTSLASILFTSAASARAHHHHGTVLWPIVYTLLPGMVGGGVAGAMIAALLPTDVLKFCFALFLIFIGLRMLLIQSAPNDFQLPERNGMIAIGGFISAVSSMLGIGGGGLMVPLFTRANIAMRNAAGTSIVCTFPIALVGTGTLIASGWHLPHLPPLTTGYVYWPAAIFVAVTSIIFAPIGVKLGSKLSNRILKRIFGIFLLITAIDMLGLRV